MYERIYIYIYIYIYISPSCHVSPPRTHGYLYYISCLICTCFEIYFSFKQGCCPARDNKTYDDKKRLGRTYHPHITFPEICQLSFSHPMFRRGKFLGYYVSPTGMPKMPKHEISEIQFPKHFLALYFAEADSWGMPSLDMQKDVAVFTPHAKIVAL